MGGPMKALFIDYSIIAVCSSYPVEEEADL